MGRKSKILILGNMANDGYSVAKEMRKMNINADLAVNVSDFGMALPEWEDADIADNVDPYNFIKNEMLDAWKPPKWIRYFDLMNKDRRHYSLFQKFIVRMKLISMIREYDVVEAHIPYCIFTQFSGIPYVSYDAGAVRYFPYQSGLRAMLLRRGYVQSKNIMYTNPDTKKIFDSLRYIRKDRLFFVPFAIDPEKYHPLNAGDLRDEYLKDDDGMLLFSPSRQIWEEKGNDKMMRAFSRFVKQYPRAKLISVFWSVDAERSKQLAHSLGLENNAIWISPVSKNKLIKYYNASDIVLDQFVLGSWGTSTPEAMACGKPVLMYYDPKYISECFGEEPPILNSFTEDEIYLNLAKLAGDYEFRKKLGEKGRDWVMKTHGPQKVVNRHLEILTRTSLIP